MPQRNTDTPLSVSQITQNIKDLLENAFLQVCVKGEVSNCKFHQNGHIYFTLKDPDAQISCVMFHFKAARLKFSPKDGDKVIVTGNISVYAPRGNYQIIVSTMQQAGQGDILQMLEERKQKYYKLGFFDPAKKKPLPAIPKTVGVVTSPTGAALRDILQIANRRNNSTDIIIFPCLTQGDNAAATIADMIQIANFYNLCDVLIVARGGGSIEDLLPFSQECVIEAVAASHIPTVTAVGHEIDYAICDFASDRRAPTPSAAAEFCFPIKDEILNTITTLQEQMQEALNSKIKNMQLLLNNFSRDNMELRFSRIYAPFLQRLDYTKEQLVQNIKEKLQNQKVLVSQLNQTLQNCSPKAILKRGFAVVKDNQTKKIIKDAKNAPQNTPLDIVLYKGNIKATVI